MLLNHILFEGEIQFYQQHSTGDEKTSSAEPLLQSVQHPSQQRRESRCESCFAYDLSEMIHSLFISNSTSLQISRHKVNEMPQDMTCDEENTLKNDLSLCLYEDHPEIPSRRKRQLHRPGHKQNGDEGKHSTQCSGRVANGKEGVIHKLVLQQVDHLQAARESQTCTLTVSLLCGFEG